jgi:hypothetical protein
MNDTISNKYLKLHNEGWRQDRILALLQLEFGIAQVQTWAALGSIDTPEGRLSEAIKDKTKYAAPSLREYL